MLDVLKSPNMPRIPQSADVADLFANLRLNWSTLSPVLYLLFGILFIFWLALKAKRKFGGDDDDD